MQRNQLRTLLASHLLRALPPSLREELFLDEATCAKLGIRLTRTFLFGKTHSVELGDLNGCLRAAVGGKKSGSLALEDGERSPVRLGVRKPGRALVQLGGQRFSFPDADLLSLRSRVRAAALSRVFAARPLRQKEEAAWFKAANARPIGDWKYVQLMTALAMTPEALVESLRKSPTLSLDTLVPQEREYYHRLVPPADTSTTLEGFLAKEAAVSRRWLLKNKPKVRCRRLAYWASAQSLVPFDDLSSLSFAEIKGLLNAGDPFSLLFGFELCRHRLPTKKAYKDLGTAFLRKLSDDDTQVRARYEVFCGCAVLAMVRLRRVFDDPSTRLFWFRLIALAQAGVMTHALHGMVSAPHFMKWSAENHGPSFVWHASVDRRHAPRWRPEWISPEQLEAEALGRCINSVALLPKAQQPRIWTNLLKKAVARLAAHKQALATCFPGPMDDFATPSVSAKNNAVLDEIEKRLQTATALEDVQGLVALAYLTKPTDESVTHIRRLLDGTAKPPRKAPIDQNLLGICAHIAASSRGKELANTVIDECVRRVGDGSVSSAADAFQTMLEACGAFEVGAEYYEIVGRTATRLAYALDPKKDGPTIAFILKTLTERDPRLSAALGQPMAMLESILAREHSLTR